MNIITKIVSKNLRTGIDQYIKLTGKNIGEFAETMNVTRMTVYDWMHGKTIPSDKHLRKMLKMFIDDGIEIDIEV